MPYGRCMYPDDYDSHVVSGIPHRGYRPSGYQHREMDDYRHGSRNPMYRTGRPHMPPSSCSYPHDCPPFRENHSRRRHPSRRHSAEYMSGHYPPNHYGMGMPPMHLGGGYHPEYDVVDPYIQQAHHSGRRRHHGWVGYGH